MREVVSLVLPLFGLILLGYVVGRWKRAPYEGLAWLNIFIIYVALPALFFRLVSNTPVERFGNVGFLLATTVGTLLTWLFAFGIGRGLAGATTREATIQGFAGAYGNIGYLGPALAIAAFGPEAGVPVALIVCFDNALHFTLAPLCMALGEPARTSARATAAAITKQIMFNPFILATLGGVAAALASWQPPAVLDQLLERLAAAAAPCALFAMGVTAALRPLTRVPIDLAWLLPVKLIVHPLIVWLLVSRVPGVDPLWLTVAVLMAALPSATNVFVLAQQYSVYEQRATSAVVISTALSVFTVTGYLWYAGAGA